MERELVAVLELLLAEEVIILGIGIDEMVSQRREIARRHQMAFSRQARCVDESRLLEPDGARILRHLFGKGFFRAANPLGENDGGVVARLNGDALNQVADAHHCVERREHGRPARRRAACAPGMLAHFELVLELEPPRFQFAEHDGERHELAHAGRRRERIGILLEQHEIGVGIHEDGVLRLGLERAGRRRSGARKNRDRADAKSEHDADRGELDPSVKARGVHGR